MITASEIKKKAERKYQGYLRRIVVCEPFEPIVIPCDKKASPTMAEYEKELKDVRSLSKEVKGYGYTIEWKKVNSKNLGLQDFPYTVLFDSSEDFDSIDIPMGYFFGFRYFFVDKIKVPLKIDVIGNQDVEISVDANDLGINTTMIEINLFVAIDIQVVIPFQENITRTEVTIPLAIEIMHNDVPYYLG